MEKKQIIFLYTELAAYFIACVEKLSSFPGNEVHIVRWKVNSEAPFEFNISENITLYSRNEYSSDADLITLIDSIRPSLIYCSGWIDKGYLKICKEYKNKIPVIAGCDNQWKGTIKQQIAKFISPFTILNHFSHCWVPGPLQEEYALKLGFKKADILTGFYCCDFDFFHIQYLLNKERKSKNFPKRFIFVGRYVDHKGIKDLWQSFLDLQNESPNDWELWCLGTGDVMPVIHPKIKHFSFVQPQDLPPIIKETGVFVLPSHFEPWGVVVHEFASAGFPIICTDEVGARTAFVENNFNGYIYEARNVKQLMDAMKKAMCLSDTELFEMGERSVIKAKQITPEIWSEKLMSLI